MEGKRPLGKQTKWVDIVTMDEAVRTALCWLRMPQELAEGSCDTGNEPSVKYLEVFE
jgi:hypothetical protein